MMPKFKKMKKKILIAFFVLNLAGFISCCGNLTYYDYDGIKTKVDNPIVAENDSLSFGYRQVNRNYMAAKVNLNYDAAYAAVDCDKGSGGPKYPLVRISVTSDTDFDETHPAGTELNDLIYVRAGTVEGIAEGRLTDLQPSEINYLYMYINERPADNIPHKFTIEVEKSNGEIYSDTSQEIVWE